MKSAFSRIENAENIMTENSSSATHMLANTIDLSHLLMQYRSALRRAREGGGEEEGNDDDDENEERQSCTFQ